jgi:hypothetical protein
MLLDRYPLLSSDIIERGTGQFYFEPKHKRWTGDDILLDVNEVTTLADALEAETVSLNELSFDRDPMWRVVRYTAGHGGKAYLVIWSDHTITDGRGLTRMVSALLDETDASLPTDPPAIARMDDNPDFQEPTTKPKAIQLNDYDPTIPAWPRGSIKLNPMTVPSNTSLSSFSAARIAKLKEVGRSNGVQTLHAILNAVWLVALWSTFRQGDSPFAIETGSPRSERPSKPDGKQAWSTANYVSLFSCIATMSPSTQFWNLASDLSNALRSEEGITQGRQKIGALAKIPNDPVTLPNGVTVSGWEGYLINSAEVDVAYKEGLQVSNLGFFDLPPDAEDIVWKMNPSPFGPAVTVQLIGHRNGLGVSTAWREGSVVSTGEMDQVQSVVDSLIQRLIGGGSRDWCLKDLVK